MAENKTGPNIQAGAGFLAKRVQKSLNRAQEKVLQKLGKTMETKDEQFEQCSQNLSKQQVDGVRLSKDVKAYFIAVKAIHESSKRLSQTLKDVYESDWYGGEDLSNIVEKEDLMWNDYEEKMSDQIVRTMENYTSQFPEVKERVAKRGRKLVDYDSARHHLEALQGAKKKDDGKIAKAEDEFNKAQNVFEELNNELREELPVLYQSRIGCYVTVFQNMSNLRDVFYKEMSVLNHELYNVMKKLETQHSGKAFIIKGLNSSKSKKRKSIVISNPIPCNTAFPADHISMHPTGQSASKDAQPSAPNTLTHTASPESSLLEDIEGTASKDPASSSSDLDDLGSNGTDTPKCESACTSESGDGGAERQSLDNMEAEAAPPELCSSQSDDSGVGVPTPEVAGPEASHPLPPVSDAPLQQSCTEQKDEADMTPLTAVKPKAPPVPAPRVSFGAADRRSNSKATVDTEKEVVEAEKQVVEAEKQVVEAEKQVVEAEKQEVEAEKQEVEAEKQGVEAEKQEVEAEKQGVEAKKQEVEAEKQEAEAEKQEAEAEKQEAEAEKQEAEAEKQEAEAEKQEAEAETQEVEAETEPSGKDSTLCPAGFLYKGVAVASHSSSEKGVLQFEQGDIILVLTAAPKKEGMLKGIREASWVQHRDLENHSGVFSEELVRPAKADNEAI